MTIVLSIVVISVIVLSSIVASTIMLALLIARPDDISVAEKIGSLSHREERRPSA